jgi:hypothetical protein
LRDAACGHLGSDLRATADEILLADGLAVGEGHAEQRGGSEEWNVLSDETTADEAASDETREMSVDELEEALQEEASLNDDPADAVETPEPELEPALEGQESLWIDLPGEWHEVERAEEPEQVQVPEPEGRITVESRPRSEEETVFERHAHAREPEPTTVDEVEQLRRTRLAELVEEHPRAEEHARPAEEAEDRPDTTERVAYLFPRPETTEWNVRELSYDRRRRAQIHAS